MKRILPVLCLTALLPLAAISQDPAGDCINISFEQFEIDAELRFINCGNDASLNTGDEITIEIWSRVWDTSWNQKLVGKTNANFNSGYVLAVDQGRIYPEIWSPGLSTFLEGFMPPLMIWNHMAVTYTSGGSMKGYVNGEEVGDLAVGGNPIASNTEDLILFIAPWDQSNFMAFGEYDEVRIWDRALTEAEINDNMHRPLSGSETGLIAYYDFNEGSGSTVVDQSGTGNDGTFQGMMGDDNRDGSRAVLGDDVVAGLNDLHALWNGSTLADPRFVSTQNGLSLTASNIPDEDYAVFAPDGGSGTTTNGVGSNAPANFNRTDRSWYVNEVGEITSDMAFSLTNAAGGGTELDGTKPAANYTLLYRADQSSDFTSLGGADQFTNGVALFEDVELATGYFSVGVGDAVYVGVSDLSQPDFSMEVFPNPSAEDVSIRIHGLKEGQLEILNAQGAVVHREQVQPAANGRAIVMQPNVELAAGVYLVRVSDGREMISQMLMRQ